MPSTTTMPPTATIAMDVPIDDKQPTTNAQHCNNSGGPGGVTRNLIG